METQNAIYDCSLTCTKIVLPCVELPYGKLRKSPVARFANTLTGFYWSIERQEVRNSSTRNILTIEKEKLGETCSIILRRPFITLINKPSYIKTDVYRKKIVYFYDKCIS